MVLKSHVLVKELVILVSSMSRILLVKTRLPQVRSACRMSLNTLGTGVIASVSQAFRVAIRESYWTDMPKKAEIIEKIRTFGEEVPKSWTKLQLESRLQELMEEHGQLRVQQIRAQLAGLNVAAKKKADLRVFLTGELGLTLTGHETVAQMITKGHQILMEKIPPVADDLMGFGKYSSSTYAQTLEHDPQYAQWCVTTALEDQANWRLKRFVVWLQQGAHRHSSLPTPKAKPRARAGYGVSSGLPSSVDMPSDFSMVSEIRRETSDEELPTDKQVEVLENQIRDLRRAQSLHRKDPSMKVDHPVDKTRKTDEQ